MEVKPTQEFYSNNWSDFVHLQYLTELLKLVPDFKLPNGETIDSVNNVIITTNKHGETPIDIQYKDNLGGLHTLHIKPEITERVNELIRENIKAVDNGQDVDWNKISFDVNGDTMTLNVQTDEKVLSATIPRMTADDLKQITKVSAYDDMLKMTYLENVDGHLETKEKVYDFSVYVKNEKFDKIIKELTDKVNNVGEVHQLSDKACSYNCVNHGKIGNCIIYNLGETGNMLINYDVDFKGCLNQSLIPGQVWEVNCIPTDLTTGKAYNDTREYVDTSVEMVYTDGTRQLLPAECNVTHVRFTVPETAKRDGIKYCTMKAILKFDKNTTPGVHQ